MAAIRIISTKIGKHTKFVSYINHIKTEAAKQNGFIRAQTYWLTHPDTEKKINTYWLTHPDIERKVNINQNFNTYISISDWKNYHAWESWLHSNQRKEIQAHFQNTILSENNQVLIPTKLPNHIFLL